MQEIDQGCTQVLVLYRGNIRMPAVVEHLLLFPRLLLDVYRYDGGGRVGRHGCVRLSSFDRSAADFCAKACADPGPAHSPTTASAGARIRVDLPDPAKQPRRIGRPIFLQCLALPLSERILHPAMITDVGPLIPPRRHPATWAGVRRVPVSPPGPPTGVDATRPARWLRTLAAQREMATTAPRRLHYGSAAAPLRRPRRPRSSPVQAAPRAAGRLRSICNGAIGGPCQWKAPGSEACRAGAVM